MDIPQFISNLDTDISRIKFKSEKEVRSVIDALFQQAIKIAKNYKPNLKLLYHDTHYECYGNNEVQFFRIQDKYYMNDNPDEWDYQSHERKSDKEISRKQYKVYIGC